MKRFLGFIVKETYHIFRDKRTLVILFGLPIVQIFLFGFALTNEIKNIRVAVLDQSNDKLTREIKARLVAAGYFTLVANVNTQKEAEKLFRSGEIREAIFFEPHFAERLIKESKAHMLLVSDASDPNTGNLTINNTQSILQSFQKSLNPALPSPPLIVPEIKLQYNPELKGVYMFVPGLIALILTLLTALMSSISIAREKELGTMEVLLVSPLKPLQIILGKVIPYLILSFSIALLILFLGATVFGVPVHGSLLLLLLECFLYALTTLSLGLLISTIASTQQTAMMASLMGLMLPTVLLSGFIYPISNMPLPLQVLSNISPAKWFIIIIKGIMHKGVGLRYLWKETLILFGMAVVLLTISLSRFKQRLGD